MTALAVVLMVTGAVLLVAEAHLASYGILGVAGALALLGGGVLAVGEAGGSMLLALALLLPVAAGLGAFAVVPPASRWRRNAGGRRAAPTA